MRRSSAATEELHERYGIADDVARSPYVEAFEQEIAEFAFRPARWSDVAEKAARADVVLLGEYHPLPTTCRTAVDLLQDAIDARRPIPALGLEMIHARDQRAVDAYLERRIGERELFRRIRYREEWGYPLRGPRAMLRFAREHGVPVVGLDVPPRGSVADLTLRDAIAAERIAAARPRPMVVIYGEAHIASQNLPRALARHAPGAKIVRVFHDLELGPAPGIEWRTAGPRTFTRQYAPPGARHRTLEAVYRTWASDRPRPGELDLPLLAHELIDGLTSMLGLDPRLTRIGAQRYLADLYPEVYGRRDVLRARRRLCEEGRPAARIIRESRRSGVLYDAPSNVLLVLEPGMPELAVECGRFLCRALGDRIDVPAGNAPGWSAVQDAGDLAFAHGLASLLDPGMTAGLPPERQGGDGAIGDAITSGRISWRAAGSRLGSRLAAELAAHRLTPDAFRAPLLATGDTAGALRLEWIVRHVTN